MPEDVHRLAARKTALLGRSLAVLGCAGVVVAAGSVSGAYLLHDLPLGLAGATVGLGALGAFAILAMARRARTAARAAERAYAQSRQREEEALGASANTIAEYRYLIESIPQLVWTGAGDGTLEFCNQSWVDATGLSVEETCAAGWSCAIHPDDAQAAQAGWQESLRSGEPYEATWRLRLATGDHRWFLARAVPLRNRSGAIVKWFGTCTDIDDQKRANEELADADRKKDEFLAMLGHELRNPLAPILTAVQLSRLKQNDGRALQRQHDIIERQVRHIVRLVDDLLDVSRITRGKIQLHLEPIDLTHAVARAVEAASALIERRGHGLSIKLPRGSLQIHADPVRVEQILFNLLQNSAKFTDPGGCISLSAKVDGDAVEIRVRDTGIGIAPESLERVFLPFEQVSDGRAGSRGGIGVGLALVKGLVELHGGTVGVSSVGIGYGAEFIVRLPGLISAEGDGDEAALATVTPFPALAAGSSSGRVLLVDDNVDAVDAIGEALQGEGYEVRVVYDGATAVTTAAEFDPGVIVLDLGLPEIDGYEVARRLREQPQHAGTLIVALTGFGAESDHLRTRQAGFDEHLVKPVDLEVLFDIIRQRFQRAETVTA